MTQRSEEIGANQMAEVNPMARKIAMAVMDAPFASSQANYFQKLQDLIARLLPDGESAVRVEREECAKARALLREAEETLQNLVNSASRLMRTMDNPPALAVMDIDKAFSVLARIHAAKNAPSSPEPPSPVPAEKAEEIEDRRTDSADASAATIVSDLLYSVKQSNFCKDDVAAKEGAIPMKKLEEMSGEELLDKIMYTRPPYEQTSLEDRGAFRAELLRRLKSAGDGWISCAERRGIYIASKTRHAEKWRELRASGVPIVSTWIDEAGIGQTKSYEDLWRRCINEACTAERLVVYAEPGDELKGALVEVGAALASGTPVFVVGEVEALKTARNHRLMQKSESLKAACAGVGIPSASSRPEVKASSVK